MISAAPFGSPGLAVVDLVRVALFVGGLALCGALVAVTLDRGVLPGRRLAAAGSAVALVVLAGSRLASLGQPVDWQLFGALAAFALFGAAFLTYRHDGTGRRGVRRSCSRTR